MNAHIPPVEGYHHVCMVREDLDGIPRVELPDDMTLRLYRPGDDETWLRVHRQAYADDVYEITPDLFRTSFGEDEAGLRRRCLFLVDADGREVGTATAWYERRWNARPWGRLHYVAIVPSARGRRLSRALSAAALERMRRLGHRRALLGTQTPRIPAIRTYLRLGFVPHVPDDAARDAWRRVAARIDHPALASL